MEGKITNAIGEFKQKDGNVAEEHLYSHKEMLEAEKNKEKSGETGEIPKELLKLMEKPKYLKRLREANILITKKKISESVKSDNLVTQAVSSIEEIDRIANTMSKRLREWYELYNPEFSHSMEDHETFVRLILKKDKDELLKEVGVKKEESMGAELQRKDLDAIFEMAKHIQALYELRKKQSDYISKTMKENYPNITEVCGAMIGAKLLSIAGSLKRMALMPASTIQLLGAEKALFRHMTTGAKPPKFGVIINHPLITKAKRTEKGKVSRGLADKTSLAAKIDFFKGEFRGDKLRKELEERFG